MRNISLLGSTGSIGVNTLEVISRHPDLFRVSALAAGRNIRLLQRQIDIFHPKVVAVIDDAHALILKDMLNPVPHVEVLSGHEGYRAVAQCCEADLVVSAITGAAGLLPTLAAVEAGKDVALANKEALVMAGDMMTKVARAKGSRILPVDSEHSAIFQCLNGQNMAMVKKLILTASGGPFLYLDKEALALVKPEEALVHPNWSMGSKITIDSATLMNKGLEVIEARWLFDMAAERIDVLIHPQSIVHSLVEFIDGSILAQLGVPDMKIPIAYALSFPERLTEAGPALDLMKIKPLEFLPPDMERFPCLRLAYEAAKTGGTMPVVLNAANEMVVQAFLAGEVSFFQISQIIEIIMERHIVGIPDNIDEILEADAWARKQFFSLDINQHY